MTLDLDYHCEKCNQKNCTLYFDYADKKWYCQKHTDYLSKNSKSNNIPPITQKPLCEAYIRK